MIESGIITEDVEKFVAINLKMDAGMAIALSAILVELETSGVSRMFGPCGEDTLEEFTNALTTAVIKHSEQFDGNNEYIGPKDELSRDDAE